MKKQNGNRFALSGNSSFIILPSAFPKTGQGGNRVAVRHGGDQKQMKKYE